MVAAHFGDRVDHVVRVFLERVVHAGVRRGRGAVVVDAEAASDVHVGDVHARAPQLDVVPRDLLKRGLDIADVGDLAADVEMDELQHVEPVRRHAADR